MSTWRDAGQSRHKTYLQEPVGRDRSRDLRRSSMTWRVETINEIG